MYSFYEQVYEIVEQIPRGKVASYGQIARILGCARAVGSVGRAMRCCPEHLPWQRVVMADGSIPGGMHAEIRKMKLKYEMVPFIDDERVDIHLCRWDGRLKEF